MTLRTLILGTAALAGMTGSVVLANPAPTTRWVEPAESGGAVLVGTFAREAASTEPSPPTRDEPPPPASEQPTRPTEPPVTAGVGLTDPVPAIEVVDIAHETRPAAPTTKADPKPTPKAPREEPASAAREAKDIAPLPTEDVSVDPANAPSSRPGR